MKRIFLLQFSSQHTFLVEDSPTDSLLRLHSSICRSDTTARRKRCKIMLEQLQKGLHQSLATQTRFLFAPLQSSRNEYMVSTVRPFSC